MLFAQLLGEALKSNTYIHTVKLAKCSLDVNDAKSIAAGLAANDSIELLDLSANKVVFLRCSCDAIADCCSFAQINNDGAKGAKRKNKPIFFFLF